jgi:hypothetical protein
MTVMHPGLGSTEPGASLERKGYWNPRHFPIIAAFTALEPQDQKAVVSISRKKGPRVGTILLRLLSKP